DRLRKPAPEFWEGPLVSEPNEFFTGTRDLPGDAPRSDQPEPRPGTTAVTAPGPVTPESAGGSGAGAGAGPPAPRRAPTRMLVARGQECGGRGCGASRNPWASGGPAGGARASSSRRSRAGRADPPPAPCAHLPPAAHPTIPPRGARLREPTPPAAVSRTPWNQTDPYSRARGRASRPSRTAGTWAPAPPTARQAVPDPAS